MPFVIEAWSIVSPVLESGWSNTMSIQLRPPRRLTSIVPPWLGLTTTAVGPSIVKVLVLATFDAPVVTLPCESVVSAFFTAPAATVTMTLPGVKVTPGPSR